MTKLSTKRPSLKVAVTAIVAATALAFSMAGGAVAGIEVAKSVTKPQVKKIAKRTADRELRANISGSRVNLADLATNATTATTATTATNLAAPEAFRLIGAAGQPAFTSSWANVGAGRTTAGFYLDKQSVVHLKGSVTGGVGGSVAFTLPVGYRPAADLMMTLGTGSNILTTGLIDDTGTVQIFCDGPCAGSVGFDAISFRVGAGGARPSDGSSIAGETPDG